MRKVAYPTPAPTRRPILIVDDEPDVRLALRRFLETKGYPTREAEDGKAALDNRALEKPGLILLDLTMPRMDGWTFLSERQNVSLLADVPIIIISISANLIRASGVLEKVAGYLPKPFEPDALLMLVAGLYEGT